ncbi:sensor histidine kinase [Dactylosporangium matsuzakiense]|uniref:histidine kinase n=1 Tax=Dactylosporangium matsuzakiense TaxID=53360 RepID=A0A9W6NPK4_9ACTN|nr:sensor histidine kinase [Dactylosporangium matsuzakiense]GLL04574.1 two-component sensor histidine kinase [Dactylosporangium matsuzakiense]
MNLRTPLTWFLLGSYPLVVAAAAANGGTDSFGLPGMRYTLPLLVVVMPLVLLPRRPVIALALMLTGCLVTAAYVWSWEFGYLRDVRFLQFIAIDLTVGYIATHRPPRVSMLAATVACVAEVGVIAVGRLASAPSFVLALTMAMLAAWLVGNRNRERRAHADVVRAQEASQAITAERLRIARELHDMVAHSISIIAIQAGVGARVIDTRPVEAHNALQAIETTSRQALAGLRRAVGALRGKETSDGHHAPLLEPLPGLADLDRLVAVTADAGVTVELHWQGARRPLPSDLDLAAFRIIQEAVTNVVRHAGTDACRVTIGHDDAELTLEIVDRGPAGPAASDATPEAKSRGGFGLLGMRERATLLRGHFTAGPRAAGGYRVAVRLPLPKTS